MLHPRASRGPTTKLPPLKCGSVKFGYAMFMSRYTAQPAPAATSKHSMSLRIRAAQEKSVGNGLQGCHAGSKPSGISAEPCACADWACDFSAVTTCTWIAPARQEISEVRAHHAKWTGFSGVDGVRFPSSISRSYLIAGRSSACAVSSVQLLAKRDT